MVGLGDVGELCAWLRAGTDRSQQWVTTQEPKGDATFPQQMSELIGRRPLGAIQHVAQVGMPEQSRDRIDSFARSRSRERADICVVARSLLLAPSGHAAMCVW